MKIFVVVLSFVGLSISSPQFGFLNNLFGGGGRRPSGGRPSGGRPSGGGRCGGGNAPNHNFQVYFRILLTFFWHFFFDIFLTFFDGIWQFPGSQLPGELETGLHLLHSGRRRVILSVKWDETNQHWQQRQGEGVHQPGGQGGSEVFLDWRQNEGGQCDLAKWQIIHQCQLVTHRRSWEETAR